MSNDYSGGSKRKSNRRKLIKRNRLQKTYKKKIDCRKTYKKKNSKRLKKIIIFFLFKTSLFSSVVFLTDSEIFVVVSFILSVIFST